MNILSILQTIDQWVWGIPLLVLLLGTGLYLTIRTGFLQVLKLPLALKYLLTKSDDSMDGDVSSFAALMTSLAATIGTGNIVGVATAIAIGGPGALFWMWIAAFFGMATKFSEALLAVKYREVDENGEMCGGPMYYIQNGLGLKWLARIFAFFGICVALLGTGTFAQVNSISESVSLSFSIPAIITAIVLSVLVALVTLGGIKSISKVAELIVPFMAIFYFFSALIILILNIDAVPAAFQLIVTSAFTKTAASGGFVGATIMMAMQSGVARGVFSNEAGLGSAPIAAAAAKTDSCVRQGLISMTGTFFDTIVLCTMTGLVLVVTGAWNEPGLSGVAVTNYAFNTGLGLGNIGQFIVTIGLIFFAFTTIIGWNYYGEKCTEYLFGLKAVKIYKYIFIFVVAIGPFLTLEVVWTLADIFNGLMAIPNLIGLLGLSGVIIHETRKYMDNLNKQKT